MLNCNDCCRPERECICSDFGGKHPPDAPNAERNRSWNDLTQQEREDFVAKYYPSDQTRDDHAG